MVSSGALVAVGRGASVAVGAAPDPVVVDVRAGEAASPLGWTRSGRGLSRRTAHQSRRPRALP